MFLNKKNILLTILFFCLLIQTNFFKNIYQVISMSHNERLIKKYGFCSNDGIGYIEYIKKKFEPEKKIKVISFNDGPMLDWLIYNTDFKSQDLANSFILINYPGKNYFKKINYNDNKFIINAEYELRLIKKINYILISNINVKNSDNFFKIILKDGQKILYEKKFDNIETDNIRFDTNYKVDSNNKDFDKLKLELKIDYNNLDINKKYDISANMLNQFDVNDFKVLNKIENCYFITKK